MQSHRGFTLVELMVTVAIMGIIATIAAPSMSKLIAQQRLNSTTRDLVITLSQARSQAALLRHEVSVTLNSGITNTSTNLYWNPTTDNTLTTTPTITNIVFKADGTVKDATANLSLVICNSKAKKTKTITLLSTGTISMGTAGDCND